MKKLSEKQVRRLGRWLTEQSGGDRELARETYVELHNRYGSEIMYRAYMSTGYTSLSGFKKQLRYFSKQ